MEMFCCPGKGFSNLLGKGSFWEDLSWGHGMSLVFWMLTIRALWKSSHANKTMCRANMRRYVFLALTSLYII